MVLTEYDEEKVMRGFYEDGMEDGVAKGRREANLETAKNLKRMGIPFEVIATCTGLSREEVKAL